MDNSIKSAYDTFISDTESKGIKLDNSNYRFIFEAGWKANDCKGEVFLGILLTFFMLAGMGGAITMLVAMGH